jgi:DNA invertase Pin-like site-specific DNA recombinase
MIVGYARTSTLEQKAGFEAQRRDLEAAGVEKLFCEQVSSVAKRDQLDAAIDFCREGDTFTVTKLDRLARSTRNLIEIIDRLEAKEVALRILNIGLDTSTPTGRLMLTMLGAVAQFERELLLERQREGIAAAKASGVYKGRAPTVQRQAEEIRAARAAGESPTDIAKRLGVARSSIYLALKEQ